MAIIDTHCHLYADEFTSDLGNVMHRVAQEKVTQILLPNIDVDSVEPMLEICKNYPELVKPMMGLHPCYVKEDFVHQLKTIQKYLFETNTPFCAVGEIGIDLYWDKTTLPNQIKAFKEQIEWALDLELPIAIHARDSMEEILSVLREYYPRGKGGVLHCFGGTLDQAKELIDLGFYLGIGGVVTFKKNTALREVLGSVPLNKIVLETDAPYLAPHPNRGKRNEPSYTSLVAEKLVDVYNVSYEEVCKQTTDNATVLFGL